MKTTIGGDRLGSGNKQEISIRNYERSTHDLSEAWRSSMACGTLVPFLKKVALPGDSFDIDLFTEVITLPTVGPLFGSYKVQLDVFQVPIRLYQAALHMNKIGIGMNMGNIMLPVIQVPVKNTFGEAKNLGNNAQVNSSCLLKYLGISGIGKVGDDVQEDVILRYFNGVPLLGYWDIYKNYYANKQEERGFGIHTSTGALLHRQKLTGAQLYRTSTDLGSIFETPVATGTGENLWLLLLQFGEDALEPDPSKITILVDSVPTPLTDIFDQFIWVDYVGQPIIASGEDTGETYKVAKQLRASVITDITVSQDWQVDEQFPYPLEDFKNIQPYLQEFPLENIDIMRERILQNNPSEGQFLVNAATGGIMPYNWTINQVDDSESEIVDYSITFSQESLAIKTYQSDLFNNWINTEWIDGENGINAVTAVDTTGDSFTIDALNLSKKVYVMLNRIAISGGTYDDWLDAVYTHERSRSIESPMYLGSLIKELAFEQVISTAEGADMPLGTLAGRGAMTDKHKGGKIRVKIDEPSYIMGIVSLTPRIDYSQGNDWDTGLLTMDDFHKPALDAIGFQDLITEQMAWQSSEITDVIPNFEITQRSAGKQPAWINYMTSVNKTYGHFAEENADMFMTLNRRYDIDPSTGEIEDLTTYIDPTKFNHIFAQTDLSAQNFWVQIGTKITARRKMSAKIIPNL